VLWSLGRSLVSPGAGASWPTPFPTEVGNLARAVSRTVGSPTTWPASWIFALRHGVAPSRYDRLSGRYLFYRQNNLGGRIDLGEADDSVMLDGGWDEAARDGGVSARWLRAQGRIFAPLDVPEPLTVRIRARAPGVAATLIVGLNGTEIGRARLDPEWRDHEVRAAAERWRRETNEVLLDVEPAGAAVAVDRVEFVRERP
jgi:hypothetical protein